MHADDGDDPARRLVSRIVACWANPEERMKLLPRSWYFYYGCVRLYRRLSACAKVLALLAGVLGIVYLNRPEMSPLRPDPGRSADGIVFEL